MEPLRVASIGLGRWGETLATKARAAGIELAACYARTKETRDEFAETHGTRAAESWDEILSDSDIEAVLLATPHSTHADLAVEATSAGKHVFVDKPFTSPSRRQNGRSRRLILRVSSSRWVTTAVANPPTVVSRSWSTPVSSG
jgi:predicted dehydrogenase